MHQITVLLSYGLYFIDHLLCELIMRIVLGLYMYSGTSL